MTSAHATIVGSVLALVLDDLLATPHAVVIYRSAAARVGLGGGAFVDSPARLLTIRPGPKTCK